MVSSSPYRQPDGRPPRLSRPIPQMLPYYNVVVIGSGYGAGVAASRMARAGQTVCVLEKGKEKWPGEFPEDASDCAKEVSVTTEGGEEVGSPNGLYTVRFGENQNVFSGTGPGGTSLLNANVALRMDDRTKNLAEWPAAIRNDPASLEENYQQALDMLRPVEYPTRLPTPRKLQVLKEQAEILGYEDDFYRPPITVTFENNVNAPGIQQYASTLTGNDATGINDGSKTTTLVTYIADAWNHGAEIYCEADVRYVLKGKNGKWHVFFAWIDEQRMAFGKAVEKELFWVAADTVFLGAGGVGSTEILLRSRVMGLPTSPSLGLHFSGNGDILAFGDNLEPEVNGISTGSTPPHKLDANNPVGPCITGIIDRRAAEVNVLDGYVIEEGSVPRGIVVAFDLMMRAALGHSDPKNQTVFEKINCRLREAALAVSGRTLKHIQTYLIMSHDADQGLLTLGKTGKAHIAFQGVGRQHHVQKLMEVLARGTHLLGGRFVPDPIWTTVAGKNLGTVHPIGGCAMADHCSDGVTNDKVQVFTAQDGTSVHQGLYVCDGAIVPCALGVNPFLIITALAERVVRLACQDKGLTIDNTPVTLPIDFESPVISHPRAIVDAIGRDGGISFSEVMHGFFSTAVGTEPWTERTSPPFDKQLFPDSRLRFFLTVLAYDVDTLINIDNSSADIEGAVNCRALSAQPLLVMPGSKFKLFTRDEHLPAAQNLCYTLILRSVDGEDFFLRGVKVVDSLSAKGGAPDPHRILGRGIIHLDVSDFAQELRSVESLSASKESRWRPSESFVGYFAAQSAKYLAMPLLPPLYPDLRNVGHNPYTSPRYPGVENYVVTASDGVMTRLVHWNKGGKGPVLLVYGAAVTYRIFATELLDVTMVDVLLGSGYEVFAIDHRLSPNSESYLAHQQTPLEDVALDIAAAVHEVKTRCGIPNVPVIAHCAGAIALSIGMLNGTINDVGSVIFSQVAMHPMSGAQDALKANLHLPEVYQRVFNQSFFDCRSMEWDGMLQTPLNQLLKVYEVVAKPQAICRNNLCHCSTFLFGSLWLHDNLDDRVHDTLQDIVGGSNMTTVAQLALMSRLGEVCDPSGDRLYVTPNNVWQRMNMPISFLHSAKNDVWQPQSTLTSLSTLLQYNGDNPNQFRRMVIPDYGHLDCWLGTHAYIDVYPRVIDELDHQLVNYNVGYGQPPSPNGFMGAGGQLTPPQEGSGGR